MGLADVAARLTGLARNFANLDLKIERLENDLHDLSAEVSALRADHTDLKIRVAVLEEARNTIRETVRAEITTVVADLRVRFAESQARSPEHGGDFLSLPPGKESSP